MHMIRAQPHANQRARVWNALALPALIGLVATHRLLGGVVPFPGGLATHVVLMNQRHLDLPGTLAVNGLLPARLARLLAAVM